MNDESTPKGALEPATKTTTSSVAHDGDNRAADADRRRAVVKLDRLTEDDRFATNQPAIAARNRGDLARFSKMLSKVLDAIGGVQ